MASNIGERVATAYESARQARITNCEERALDPSKEDEAHMIAAQDAARLQTAGVTSTDERLHTTSFVNYTGITQKEADIIKEEERKALGCTPPADSLAAEAQAFASAHWRRDPAAATARGTMPTSQLREAARMDAARIATERGQIVGSVPSVDFTYVTKEVAARLQSAEHQILGQPPPSGSVAATAKGQSAADRNAQIEDTVRKFM